MVDAANLHACDECEKSFKKRENLQSHISAVHKVCLSNCDKCGKEFKNLEYLRNHVNKVHDVVESVCDVCTKVCKSKSNLYNHKRDVHERVENLLCNLCGEMQKNYSYLSRHKRRFCKFKSIKIPKIKQSILENKESIEESGDFIDKDMENVADSKITPIEENREDIGILENIDAKWIENLTDKELIAFTANVTKNDDPVCKEKIKDEISSSIDEGMGTVDNDWEFCDLETDDGFQVLEKSKSIATHATENRKDKVKENLLSTVRSEKIKIEIEDVSDVKQDIIKGLKLEKDPEIRCSECNQVFRQQRYLKWHIREVHSVAEMATCETCLKQFKHFHLQKHIKDVHTKEESHCDECGKVYQNRKNLRNHKNAVHRVAELSTCEMCFKSFKCFNLQKHIQDVHTKVMSPCDECGKIYSNTKRLREHKSVVHSNKQLLCDICCKVFKCPSYLASHIRRFHNSVDEENDCDQCGKVFKSKNKLYLHNMAVHTIENIPCSVCGKVSRNSYLLKKHIKHNHSMIED